MYFYRRLADWKTKVGEFPDAAKSNFDDSDWETISPGWSWNRGEGERWFRKKFVVPEEVMDVGLRGSTLLLRVVALAGIELYIDGEFVDSADYWFDGLHTLSENAKGGETHVIVLRSPAADSNGHFNFAEWYLAEVEAQLLDIGLTEAKGQLIRDLVDIGEIDGELPAAAEVGEFDRDISLPELHASIAKLGEELMPSTKRLEDLTTFLVGHAHIDMNWLWDWEDTIETTRRTFTSIEKIMGEFPELIFSQSQAAVYRIMQDHCPEIFEDIRKRVKEGRWDITASTWVEGDLNMASGESLVRQTTCALNYIEENFGVTPRIAWCPDTFGHPWTYPQILSKCGIEFYYAHRCTRPEGEHLFWWESRDGSRVLVFNEGVTYNNKIEPELAKSIPKMIKNFGVNSHLVVFGVGDHGGGPTRMDLLNGRRISSEKGFPKLRYARAEEFYDAVKDSDDIPTVKDELNFVFEGCYTTHSDIKRMNRRGEAMLYHSEVLGSLASTRGREYPHHLLETAWQSILFNQFHDLLDGSGIHVAYEHSHEIFEEASDICSGISRVSLPAILGLDGKGDCSEFISVFNTLGWERVEPVCIRASGDFSSVIEESTGKSQPVQVIDDCVVFTARVPGVGHSVYRLVKGKTGEEVDADSPRAIAPSHKGQPYVLENRFFRLVVDQESGTISSLIDKRLGRNLVGPADPVTEPLNVFQLCHEKPHGMSAWRIGPISRIDNLLDGASIEIAGDGPVRASLRIKREFGHSSSLVQEIVLHRDVARIDFETEVDWQEIGGPDVDSPMLKVAFPLSHSSATCVREIPFGHIESPTDGREIPSLTFLELPGDGFGVSLLNDSKYGHDVRGNTVRLTLLRAAYDPDPRPDVGVHRFTYSLLPHRGDWTQAEVWKHGHSMNLPLDPVPGRAEESRSSWLEIGASGVDLAALKVADSGDALVLRLVEMHGREVSFDLAIGWKADRMIRCNLREVPTGETREIEGGSTSVTLSPFEVCTFRVE